MGRHLSETANARGCTLPLFTTPLFTTPLLPTPLFMTRLFSTRLFKTIQPFFSSPRSSHLDASPSRGCIFWTLHLLDASICSLLIMTYLGWILLVVVLLMMGTMVISLRKYRAQLGEMMNIIIDLIKVPVRIIGYLIQVPVSMLNYLIQAPTNMRNNLPQVSTETWHALLWVLCVILAIGFACVVAFVLWTVIIRPGSIRLFSWLAMPTYSQDVLGTLGVALVMAYLLYRL